MAPFTKLLLSVAMFLLSQATTIAQCPSVTLTAANGNCLGTASLSLSGADSAIKIDWYKNDTAVISIHKTGYASTGITVAGGNGQGYAANQLNAPLGIYMDSVGNIFVTDEIDSNSSIKKWVPGASSGVKVAGGQGYGSAANKLNRVIDVFVDATGNHFIADINNHRIQKWVPGADSGITVAGGNGAGSAANQLLNPRGVFVDDAGNIFIADTYNNRIQKWAPGAENGITVAGGNGLGAAANQFYYPYAVYVDAFDNIFIADWNNVRIQKWAPGATSGITVAGGNGLGNAANQFNKPGDLYVDSLGNIFIADNSNHRIQKWALGAEFGITVAGGNGRGAAPNQLNNPRGVSVDIVGDIFITDLSNNRVQKWAKLPAPGIDTNYMPVSVGSYTAVVAFPSGCTVNSNVVIVTSCNYWTGAVNNLWNVPGNWSTGVVPDANTAVFINSGTVVVSADAVCYSLTVAPGVNVTVNPGVNFTVLH